MTRMLSPKRGLETLFGSFDENLKFIESLLHVQVRTQGHDLLVEGEPTDVSKVERLIDQLASLLREGYRVSNGDIKTAAQLVAEDPTVDLRDYFLKAVATQSGKRRVMPRASTAPNLEAIEQQDIVFGLGLPGPARPISPWPRPCRS